MARIPEGMSFVEAAAIPQAGVLASQALLEYGEVESGQSVVVNGAGGGVDTRTTRPPWRHLRALKPGGIYVTVGGHVGRLAQFALCSPVFNLFSGKRLKMVVLKPNKDLPFFNQLFTGGELQPVIDGPYQPQDLRAVFELYAQGR